jgi:hypothetical protein
LNTIHQRRQKVLESAAARALDTPLKDSGFWFHGDMRENMYLAMHLFAATVEEGVQLPGDWKGAAEQLALRVIDSCLSLQDCDPDSPVFGHWPIKMADYPSESRAHPMAAEFMSTVLFGFERLYSKQLPAALNRKIAEALKRLYQSGAYREKELIFDHHSAKYCVIHYIQGEQFQDEALYASALERLHAIVDFSMKNGFKEYGSLPWFWQWIQVWDIAWQSSSDPAIKAKIEELLQLLWQERADFHLKGAWVGAHSRTLPPDIPSDQSRLLDYIQFGDTTLPSRSERWDAAAFIRYEVSDSIRQFAMAPAQPFEMKRLVPSAEPDGARLHHYVYKTADYALGGMWERAIQFLNEQHRWDFSFPPNEEGHVNQAFFFHPGEHYKEGGYRHQSQFQEIVIHRNSIIAGYCLPEEGEQRIIGILPLGETEADESGIYIRHDRVYLAAYLMNPYHMERNDRGIRIESTGRYNAVVMEATTEEEAKEQGIHNLEHFVAAAKSRYPRMEYIRQDESLQLEYRSRSGYQLELHMKHDMSSIVRRIDGVDVDLDDGAYKVRGTGRQ